MKKQYLALIPFILGTICAIAYNIIGSEVAPDGMLIEPFFLIPVSYLFFLIGILCLAGIAASSLYRRFKISKN